MRTLASVLFLAALPGGAQTMAHSSMGHGAPYQGERLGTVSFSVSCAGPSQAAMNRGVALLHDFWYEEARSHFDRMVKSDPTCAMAHWGVAMSVFHQIWDRPTADNLKLGWAEMQKAQSLTAGTPREREYIDALAAFYQPGAQEFPARIEAYSKAMGVLYERHPDDVEAGAFYALSILAAKAPDDSSVTRERQAMAVLEPLLAKYPDNPGLVHYIIHSCDNPTMAAEGLAAADRYWGIAQSGPHAFHMPGHIYARLGLWPQDIASQLGSIAASETAERSGESGIMDEPHSFDFLVYAYLQSGQEAKAKSAIERSTLSLKHLESMPGMGSGYMAGMVPYYRSKLPAFYALEMHDWQSAAALEPAAGSPPEVAAMVYWARALAHGRLRQHEQAKADLAHYDALMEELKKGEHAYYAEGIGPRIVRGEMLAWTAFAEGKEDEALQNMRTAADLQDQVGQAEVDIPAREMLADMLLDFGKPGKALSEYQVALKLSPNRLNGLYNAGRAAEAAGDHAKAQYYYAALMKSTNNGQNSARPELAHARTFVASTAK